MGGEREEVGLEEPEGRSRASSLSLDSTLQVTRAVDRAG